MDEKDHAEEFELLKQAQEAGRTDGDGPEDVAEIEVIDDGE